MIVGANKGEFCDNQRKPGRAIGLSAWADRDLDTASAPQRFQWKPPPHVTAAWIHMYLQPTLMHGPLLHIKFLFPGFLLVDEYWGPGICVGSPV